METRGEEEEEKGGVIPICYWTEIRRRRKRMGNALQFPAREKEKEANKAFSVSFIVEQKKPKDETDNENSSKLRDLSLFVQNVWNLLVFLQKLSNPFPH